MEQRKLGFGDYGILERLNQGEPIRHYEGTLWTMLDQSLAQSVNGILTITEVGRLYLLRNKKPQFPASASRPTSLVGVVGDMLNRVTVEKGLWRAMAPDVVDVVQELDEMEKDLTVNGDRGILPMVGRLEEIEMRRHERGH